MIADIIKNIFRGIVLGLLYFEITGANDTTMENIVLFVSFYTVMVYGAALTGIDPTIVTNAFITRTVFTLVDEKVRKQDEKRKV
jgi:hypothetical protein